MKGYAAVLFTAGVMTVLLIIVMLLGASTKEQLSFVLFDLFVFLLIFVKNPCGKKERRKKREL